MRFVGTSTVAPLSDGDKEIEKYLAVGTVQKKDLGFFGLFDTKDEFIPFVVSSSFWHSVYCLNCSSGMCFLSKRKSYKGKEKSVI